MTRLGMTIDLDKCMDTRACLGACKQEYALPIGSFWCKVYTSTSGEFPNTETYFIPIICQHCENPKCVEKYPEIFSKREDGIVVFEKDPSKYAGKIDESIVDVCPYGAIAYDKDTQTVGKCDLCAHLIDEGKMPACANACNSAAWVFGDFDDPESAVSKTVSAVGEDACHKLKPEEGTGPTMVYLLRKKQWKDMDGLRVR